MENVITKEVLHEMLNLDIECPDDFCLSKEHGVVYREKWIFVTKFFRNLVEKFKNKCKDDLDMIKCVYGSIDSIKQFYMELITDCISDISESR